MTFTIEKHFVRALPVDNPYCDEKYVQVLKETFKNRPALLEAYLYGSWDAATEPDQVIHPEWLRDAALRMTVSPPLKRYIVCDPARFGDDDAVIYLMEDAEIADKEILPYCKVPELSGAIKKWSHRNDDCVAVIESVGSDIGAAIIDELTEMGVETIQFNPAIKLRREKGQGEDPKYDTMRDKAWDEASMALCTGVIDKETNTQVILKNMYSDLETQLLAAKYKWKGTRLLIEPKDEMKKRLRKSPNDADTYIIALWAWPRVEPIKKHQDRWRRKKKPKSSWAA